MYFAYPVVLATLGDQGLAQAILFDLGQSTLTLTLIYGLAVWHGAGASTLQSVLVRLLSSPPLWALCGSLTLNAFGYHLPAARLHEVLVPLHLTTTPLASLVLGLSISVSVLRRAPWLALLGVTLRMVGGLLLGLAVAWLLNLVGWKRAVVVLVAAPPSAVTAILSRRKPDWMRTWWTSIVALSICLGVGILPWPAAPRPAAPQVQFSY